MTASVEIGVHDALVTNRKRSIRSTKIRNLKPNSRPALYQRLIGRAATQQEKSGWAAVAAAQGRPQVISSIWRSTEPTRTRVTRMFQLYLDRTPTTSERDGRVNQALTLGDGSVRTGLTSSPEYRRHAATQYPTWTSIP